jgi:hypothetical protein
MFFSGRLTLEDWVWFLLWLVTRWQTWAVLVVAYVVFRIV